MIQSVFDGEKVTLSAINLEIDAVTLARWTHDPNYLQLLDQEPVRPLSPGQIKKKYLSEDKPDSQTFRFAVRIREDNRLVGIVALSWIDYSRVSAWLSLGIGDPQERGKGYGRETLKLILNFAFNELNLHRVNCWVVEYNMTAQHLLESQGFRLEARSRQAINRFDRRFDVLMMGILQADWLELEGKQKVAS
ncbi:MAG: GNAT family protein [Anaerolineaceae bacterium]|nr:GNAT family protein [Anaerolineaceae bacterium]